MLTIKKLGVSLAAMGRKGVLIGIFVVLVVLGVIFGIKKARQSKEKPLEIPTPVVIDNLESKFKFTLPDNAEKINLQAASGFEGIGIATRSYENGVFTYMIIADLPQPTSGNYQAWLVKDETTKILMGVLEFAKGGYLLEFNSNINYSDYKKVEVKSQGNIVLSGSF